MRKNSRQAKHTTLLCVAFKVLVLFAEIGIVADVEKNESTFDGFRRDVCDFVEIHKKKGMDIMTPPTGYVVIRQPNKVKCKGLPSCFLRSKATLW